MNCKHTKWILIKSWNQVSTTAPHTSHGQIVICEECGLISVQDVTDGVGFHHEFRIYDDDSVKAIHQYRKIAGIE